MNPIVETFARLFSTAENRDPAEVDLSGARRVLDAKQTGYLDDLLRWIDEQNDRPIPMTGDTSMIGAAARANTLREVRAKVLRDVRRAEAAFEEAKRERDA